GGRGDFDLLPRPDLDVRTAHRRGRARELGGVLHELDRDAVGAAEVAVVHGEAKYEAVRIAGPDGRSHELDHRRGRVGEVHPRTGLLEPAVAEGTAVLRGDRSPRV